MTIFVKSALFIKNLYELYFLKNILHVKLLILMYYFIFLTIPSLLGKKKVFFYQKWKQNVINFFKCPCKVELLFLGMLEGTLHLRLHKINMD